MRDKRGEDEGGVRKSFALSHKLIPDEEERDLSKRGFPFSRALICRSSERERDPWVIFFSSFFYFSLETHGLPFFIFIIIILS